MKRPTLQRLLAIIAFISSGMVSATWIACSHQQATVNEQKPNVETPPAVEKSVSLKDLPFSYDPSLFSEARGEIVPASPLEDATHKPDYVAPRHIRFRFSGPYVAKHQSSASTPEICIYPIDGYKQAYSIGPHYVRLLEEDIDKLKNLIAGDPASWRGEIPYLPFIDASQAFHAHVKRVDFQNGKGVFFLTQFNIEPSTVHNQGVTYIYQGLTNDGQYYVLATFPVSAAILARNSEAWSHDGYSLSSYSFIDQNKQKAYDAYVVRVAGKLEKLPPERYEPNLMLFEKMIRSLRVNWPT